MRPSLAPLLLVPALSFAVAVLLLQPAEGQVLTAAAVTAVIGGLAALALAKEGILASGISRGAAFHGNTFGRRRRSIVNNNNSPPNLVPFFEAVARSDSSDCGKMLVCHIMAKPEMKRTVDEKRVAALFDDNLNHIDVSSSAHASYQLAALVGTQRRSPDLCSERYSRCPSSLGELQEVLQVHSGMAAPNIKF